MNAKCQNHSDEEQNINLTGKIIIKDPSPYRLCRLLQPKKFSPVQRLFSLINPSLPNVIKFISENMSELRKRGQYR